MAYDIGKLDNVKPKPFEPKESQALDSCDNNYVIGSTSWGDYCYSLAFFIGTMAKRPRIAVELGVFEGFATYQIGAALKCLGSGKLYSYDLWENYEFTHCKKEIAERNLTGLSDYVELIQRDAVDVHKDYADGTVDMLVVDLSNDGNTYIEYLFNWYDKLSPQALILFEGGSHARDNCQWMLEYKKPPIRQVLATHPFILSHYNYGTTEVYPGMTIFTKKEF